VPAAAVVGGDEEGVGGALQLVGGHGNKAAGVAKLVDAWQGQGAGAGWGWGWRRCGCKRIAKDRGRGKKGEGGKKIKRTWGRVNSWAASPCQAPSKPKG
jgi:hypothetical protein